MSELVRFTVSLEADLLERFDRYCSDGQIATRSEAIRQVLRDTLTAQACAEDAEDVVASMTLVYDHHKTGLTDKLLEAQHQHTNVIVASMHVHLNHDTCLEVIVLRGKASALQALGDSLRGLKGVHKGQIVFATAPGHA